MEQVVIGTHGRLHQWMNRRLLPARNLKILVFDEADEMLKVKPLVCMSQIAPYQVCLLGLQQNRTPQRVTCRAPALPQTQCVPSRLCGGSHRVCRSCCSRRPLTTLSSALQ